MKRTMAHLQWLVLVGQEPVVPVVQMTESGSCLRQPP